MARHFYVGDFRSGTEVTATILSEEPREGLSCSFVGQRSGVSGIRVDDPNKTLNLKGFTPFYMTESAASPIRVFTGILAGKAITELDGSGSLSGRAWDCDLWDLNVIAGMKVLRNKSASRPAETDLARIDWLLTAATGGIRGLVFDNGGVMTVSPRNQDEADCRKQTAEQVLADLASDRRLWAIYWDESALADEEISLWYNFVATVRGDLTTKLSNVAGDIDNSTCFALLDGTLKLDRNPEDVVDGVYTWYRNGNIYRTRPATTTAFFAAMGPGFGRDLVYDNQRIGRLATAETITEQLLDRGDHERDTITGTWHCSAAQLNLIREGYRVQVKLSHLPGYTSFTWMTVLNRVIRVAAIGAPFDYEVDLTMSAEAPTSAGGGGGGGTGGLPTPPAGAPSAIQEAHSNTGSVSFPLTPTDGHLLVMAATFRAGAPTTTPGDGWTYHGTCTVADEFGTVKHWAAVYTKTASSEANLYPTVPSGIGAVNTVDITEWPTGTTFGQIQAKNNQQAQSVMDCGGTIVPEAASVTMGLACIGQFEGSSPTWTYSVTPDAGVTEYEDERGGAGTPYGWVGYKVGGTSVGGTLVATPTFGSVPSTYYQWGGLTWTLVGAAAENPPQTGQEVPWTVVAVTPGATTSTGTTLHPYAAGSLKVKVDGVLISPSSYQETDPTTGAFTLLWVIDADEVVTVTYQGI